MEIDIEKIVNESLGVMKARDGDEGRIKAFLKKQKNDESYEHLYPVLRDVLNPNKEVYGDIVTWGRVVEKWKGGRVRKDEGNRVYLISLLNPSCLRDAVIMGANCGRSLLWDWFSRYHKIGFHDRHHEVKFSEFTEITGNLRGNGGNSNRKVEIAYFLDEPYFSKYKAGQETVEGRKVIERMDREALSYFGEKEKFLWVANKKIWIDNKEYRSELEGASNVKRISPISHGINGYDGYHSIYISAALNNEPKCLKILRELGFDPDVVHAATNHETAQQCIMRTSLRRDNATEKVRILITDRSAAEKTGELLQGQGFSVSVSKYSSIRTKPATKQAAVARPSLLSRQDKAPPLTPTEKKRRSRARQTVKKCPPFSVYNIIEQKKETLFDHCNEAVLQPSKCSRERPLYCILNFFQSIKATKPEEFDPVPFADPKQSTLLRQRGSIPLRPRFV